MVILSRFTACLCWHFCCFLCMLLLLCSFGRGSRMNSFCRTTHKHSAAYADARRLSHRRIQPVILGHASLPFLYPILCFLPTPSPFPYPPLKNAPVSQIFPTTEYLRPLRLTPGPFLLSISVFVSSSYFFSFRFLVVDLRWPAVSAVGRW